MSGFYLVFDIKWHLERFDTKYCFSFLALYRQYYNYK